MKSTLINMVAVLSGITLVASAGVGAVYMITKDPIAQADAQAKIEALTKVLPPFETTTSDVRTIEDTQVTVYTATKEGAVTGYAVEAMSKNGFGGAINLMVGFTPEGEVVNVSVLKQAETPGLGTKMADEGNSLLASIQGQRPEEKTLVDGRLAVKKDGGDVDALTAATISSRAYIEAVNRAWMAYKQVATGGAATDEEAAEAVSQNVNEEGGANE